MRVLSANSLALVVASSAVDGIEGTCMDKLAPLHFIKCDLLACSLDLPSEASGDQATSESIRPLLVRSHANRA